MSLRDAYRLKMEARLEEQIARLNLLKAQAKGAVADGKIMAYEELIEAERKLAELKTKMTELREASESAWGTMKDGVERAVTDLGEACKKAAETFKSEPGS